MPGVAGADGKQVLLPELPMPRDSQLLSANSRALLRAARAGCIYVRQAGQEAANDGAGPKGEGAEEKDGAGAGDGDDGVNLADRNFVTRKWTAVPRHMEPPELEFLAKRRPGLSSLYAAGVLGADGGTGAAEPGPMRKTRFKKVDPATGNISIYDAWVPEGLLIDGEIVEDTQTVAAQNTAVTVTPEAPAPGTVVDGVGVVNSEGAVVAEAGSTAVMARPKRRPPPPKRKGKGIGRGRGRKKVMFARGEGADASVVHGTEATPTDGTGVVKAEGVDTPQPSVDQSGQDEEEEEGEEVEESDEGDESVMDTKTPETPLQQGNEDGTAPAESKDTTMEDASQAGPGSVAAQPEAKGEDRKPPTEDVVMTGLDGTSEFAQTAPATTTESAASAQDTAAQPPAAEMAQAQQPVEDGNTGKPVSTEPTQPEPADQTPDQAANSLSPQPIPEQEPATQKAPEQEQTSLSMSLDGAADEPGLRKGEEESAIAADEKPEVVEQPEEEATQQGTDSPGAQSPEMTSAPGTENTSAIDHPEAGDPIPSNLPSAEPQNEQDPEEKPDEPSLPLPAEPTIQDQPEPPQQQQEQEQELNPNPILSLPTTTTTSRQFPEPPSDGDQEFGFDGTGREYDELSLPRSKDARGELGYGLGYPPDGSGGG